MSLPIAINRCQSHFCPNRIKWVVCTTDGYNLWLCGVHQKALVKSGRAASCEWAHTERAQEMVAP